MTIQCYVRVAALILQCASVHYAVQQPVLKRWLLGRCIDVPSSGELLLLISGGRTVPPSTPCIGSSAAVQPHEEADAFRGSKSTGSYLFLAVPTRLKAKLTE